MARSKLQSAVGGGAKDSTSLHRWVLLKNSIVRSSPSDATTATPEGADVTDVYPHDDEEVHEDEDSDAFMFPDPDAVRGSRDSGLCDPENQWLDSLLQTLGDDDQAESEVPVNAADDDDEPLSPLCSPMSSSDDLVNHSSYYEIQPPLSIPYPVPYPPLHPPLVPAWFEDESPSDSLLDSSPPLYHDPLPYYDVDDTEDLAVPDAIEDTSDDESDAPSTPCYRSTTSLSPTDPASIPLPPEQTRLRSHPLQPRVYIDTDDSYFYPFDLTSMPSHDDDHPISARVFQPPIYQEC
ncbi:hypothetical protein SCP_0408760 [Sparassis crispa]|uniref:Uncharacterized protein n=1 Tax=Sparassis crispa TaxID=139825 RepID=A0A401GK07_9APHY|nr:hypothetical protein SCP_0408760 [Sparassis crispa]GBE82492.1 hypothetical protein SCP_0408760 [Sparassis crispa]